MERRGFTLLELMIVTVLIGIVTALILPQMRGTFEDMLLRSTGRTLASAFAIASSQAITLNQPHRVRLDTTGGRYSVERAAQSGGAGAGFVSVADVPGANGELDQRITIQVRTPLEPLAESPDQPLFSRGEMDSRIPKGQVITFYPDGTADPKEVLLRDRDGFGLALRVNPTTARVRILRLDRQ